MINAYAIRADLSCLSKHNQYLIVLSAYIGGAQMLVLLILCSNPLQPTVMFCSIFGTCFYCFNDIKRVFTAEPEVETIEIGGS